VAVGGVAVAVGGGVAVVVGGGVAVAVGGGVAVAVGGGVAMAVKARYKLLTYISQQITNRRVIPTYFFYYPRFYQYMILPTM
jgi:hypothetical protein